jgi:hypothetical protein
MLFRPDFDQFHPNADENRNACECADKGDFAKAVTWLREAWQYPLEYQELLDDYEAASAYVQHKADEAGVTLKSYRPD